MFTRFLMAGLVPLFLGCCATDTLLGGGSAHSSDDGLSSDVELISAYPGLVRRQGKVLTVLGQTFEDRGECVSGDCTRYRVDGVWRNQYVGVEVSHYEETDYFLVMPNHHIPIGSRPIPSPGGKHFFSGHHDDRRWSPYQGSSIWTWNPFPRRLRIVDTDLVAFDSFVSWHGESCVEFTGARGYNVRMEPTRTFWLTEADGDWRLSGERPANCA